MIHDISIEFYLKKKNQEFLDMDRVYKPARELGFWLTQIYVNTIAELALRPFNHLSTVILR